MASYNDVDLNSISAPATYRKASCVDDQSEMTYATTNASTQNPAAKDTTSSKFNIKKINNKLSVIIK